MEKVGERVEDLDFCFDIQQFWDSGNFKVGQKIFGLDFKVNRFYL